MNRHEVIHNLERLNEARERLKTRYRKRKKRKGCIKIRWQGHGRQMLETKF